MLALIAALLSCLPALAAETNAPATSDFEAFKLIHERNIFNQNRFRDGTPSTARPSRTSRTDSFALVGTLVGGEKGDFAFFEGSSDAYKKRAQKSDKIADYTLAAITPNYVKLEADGKSVDLPVGTQMQRQDEGEWRQAEFTPTTSDIPTLSSLKTQYLNTGRGRGRGGRGAGLTAGTGGFGGGGFGNQSLNTPANGAGDPNGFGRGGGRRNRDDATGNGGDFGGGRGGRGRTRTFNSESGTDTSAASAQTTTTTTTSSGESPEEVLKRLQQRRAQETQP